jgi:glyoxylase-like metal-dependent hydrolase (beta-lactamase superfamily II)
MSRPERAFEPRNAAPRALSRRGWLPALLCAAVLGAAAALGAAAVLGAAALPAAPRAPAWQVFAIRYATLPKFPVSDLVSGADTTRTIDIAMMFWLLREPGGRRVLVDAGFYRQKFLDSWKPADYRRPSDAVQSFGIPPDSITDIIVSHIHWDHVDGADLFPRARVWLQRAEYEYYVGPDGAPLHEAIDTTDAKMLADLNRAGRVRLVDGDAREILPGLTVYTGGKHTFASQYVGVHTATGTTVVASDNCYLYENLDGHRPITQTLDSTSNLAAQERMRHLASDRRMIVPGHDPAVFTRFHGVAPGIVAIE